MRYQWESEPFKTSRSRAWRASRFGNSQCIPSSNTGADCGQRSGERRGERERKRNNIVSLDAAACVALKVVKLPWLNMIWVKNFTFKWVVWKWEQCGGKCLSVDNRSPMPYTHTHSLWLSCFFIVFQMTSVIIYKESAEVIIADSSNGRDMIFKNTSNVLQMCFQSENWLEIDFQTIPPGCCLFLSCQFQRTPDLL